MHGAGKKPLLENEINMWEIFSESKENHNTQVSRTLDSERGWSPKRKSNGQLRVRATSTRDSIETLEDIISTRSDFRLISSSKSHRLVICSRQAASIQDLDQSGSVFGCTRMQFETLGSNTTKASSSGGRSNARAEERAPDVHWEGATRFHEPRLRQCQRTLRRDNLNMFDQAGETKTH